MFSRLSRIKMIHKAGAIAFAAALFLMPGCSGKNADIPELMAPVVMNESFRPVSYGDVGTLEYRDAMVVPTTYGHFFETATYVSEIYVELGQYVEAGTLLASADIKQTQELISSIQKEKEHYIQTHSNSNSIYEQELMELDYKKQGFEMLKDGQGAGQTAKDIAILQENHRYDELLYEYKLKKYDQSLSEYYEIVNNGEIYARKSGYVSFCRDLGVSNYLEAAENVVVISDYENCYVELSTEQITSNICERYPNIYTMLGGVKYELVESPYQVYEVLAAESKDMYPNLRLRFEDESKMPSVGNSIPVFFAKEVAENVLFIGKDSLYEDAQGHYVYVKTDTGKDVRRIEIGKKDEKNVEVVSGLKEGEKVFYSSESLMPSEYEMYTVQSGQYVDLQSSDRIQKVDKSTKSVFADYEGKIVEIVADDSDYVEKNGVICKIEVDEGTAALADMRNTMESMKNNYENQLESMEELIESLEEQQKQPIEQTIEVTDEDGNVKKKKQYITRPYIRGEISCQIAITRLRIEQAEREYQYQLMLLQERYNKASKNNDGTGIISICADREGTIKKFDYRVGDKVELGDELCQIETPCNPYAAIITKAPLGVNQKVTFIDEGLEEKYTGTIIGPGGNALDRVQIDTLDGDIYVHNTGFDGKNGWWNYIQLDDNEYFTNYSLEGDKYVEYSARTIPEAFVLPTGIVNSEYLIVDQCKLYFVWKIEAGELVKQYVEYLYSAVDENGYRYDCVISGIQDGDELAKNQNAKMDAVFLDNLDN